MNSITPETRQKLRKWSAELNKISKQDQIDEVDAWITAAVRILIENEKTGKDKQNEPN